MSAHAHYKYAKNKTTRKKKKASNKEPLLYFAVIFGPLMTLPQIYEIWVNKSAGVSLLTWCAYTVTSTIWLFHGLKIKDAALITVQIIWLVLSVAIVTGLLLL